MPGKAAKVTITERQKVILDELSRSRSEAKMIAQRAAIVLHAFDGCLNEDISVNVGLERKQVGVWRRRWQDAWESLTCLECREPRRLREAIRNTLRDAPRPGAPGIFTAEQIAQILAVACEPPEKSGRPITHWTHRELRDEVMKRGIVEKISLSHIGYVLREAALPAASAEDVAEHHRERSGRVSAAGRNGLQDLSSRFGSLRTGTNAYRLLRRNDGHSGIGADRPYQAGSARSGCPGGIRVRSPRHNDADWQLRRGDGTDVPRHSWADSYRKRLRHAHRTDGGSRSGCKLGFHCRHAQHSLVRGTGEMGGRAMRAESAVGKKKGRKGY